MNVFDIGARNGLHRAWADFGLPIRYVCFEPDADEAGRIITTKDKVLEGGVQLTVANIALFDREGDVTINIYQEGGLSSLFELNREDTYRYKDSPLVKRVKVPVTTLEKFCAEKGLRPDYLSIDAQGSAIGIFRGGESILPNVLGIRCEAEFSPLYIDAPLFDDTFSYLRKKGFELLRLEMCGPPIYGVSTEMNEYSISPWDGRPASCDLIFANRSAFDKLLGELKAGTTPANAERFAYFVNYTIHNGAGYYGIAALAKMQAAGKLGEIVEKLSPAVRTALMALAAYHLSVPRVKLSKWKVNEDFNGRAVFESFFGTPLSKQADSLSSATRAKLNQIYAQKYND